MSTQKFEMRVLRAGTAEVLRTVPVEFNAGAWRIVSSSATVAHPTRFCLLRLLRDAHPDESCFQLVDESGHVRVLIARSRLDYLLSAQVCMTDDARWYVIGGKKEAYAPRAAAALHFGCQPDEVEIIGCIHNGERLVNVGTPFVLLHDEKEKYGRRAIEEIKGRFTKAAEEGMAKAKAEAEAAKRAVPKNSELVQPGQVWRHVPKNVTHTVLELLPDNRYSYISEVVGCKSVSCDRTVLDDGNYVLVEAARTELDCQPARGQVWDWRNRSTGAVTRVVIMDVLGNRSGDVDELLLAYAEGEDRSTWRVFRAAFEQSAPLLEYVGHTMALCAKPNTKSKKAVAKKPAKRGAKKQRERKVKEQMHTPVVGQIYSFEGHGFKETKQRTRFVIKSVTEEGAFYRFINAEGQDEPGRNNGPMPYESLAPGGQYRLDHTPGPSTTKQPEGAPTMPAEVKSTIKYQESSECPEFRVEFFVSNPFLNDNIIEEFKDVARKIRHRGDAETHKISGLDVCIVLLGEPFKSRMTRAKEALVQTGKIVKDDATEAAWRTAGSQFVKLTREPLVAMLCKHIAPDDQGVRARLAAFLETEVGTAMLSAFLSLALGAMPAGAGDTPALLSRELRVRAMSDVGDVLAELLMGPLRLVMTNYLAGVPQPGQQSQTAGSLGQPPPQVDPVAETGRLLRVAVPRKEGTE